MKEVLGIGKKEEVTHIYFVRVGNKDIPVNKEEYYAIKASLGNGDYWVYDDEKEQLYKVATQLNLLEGESE